MRAYLYSSWCLPLQHYSLSSFTILTTSGVFPFTQRDSFFRILDILAVSSLLTSIPRPRIHLVYQQVTIHQLHQQQSGKMSLLRPPRRAWTAEEDNLVLSLRQQDPHIPANQFGNASVPLPYSVPSSSVQDPSLLTTSE